MALIERLYEQRVALLGTDTWSIGPGHRASVECPLTAPSVSVPPATSVVTPQWTIAG